MAITAQQHRDKSRELQRKLYRAAKQSRNRRFHALYDRIFRSDILWRAWKEVKANGGSAGIDGVTIDDIGAMDVPVYLETLAEELRTKRYRPRPVKRVYIPKSDGKERPLGIPTVKDRIVQQACRIVMEPIFEATFENCSYGFRPNRSAHQAVREVKSSLVRGWHVVDADIEGYFDNIDHEILLKLVQRRVSDKRVLKLIRLWLRAGIIESGQYYRTEKGTPQGGVISPLLANIYLHVLDRYWLTECTTLGKLVRYCDDFVIICRRRRDAEEALKGVKALFDKLKLKLHPEKTILVDPKERGFDFLGFHFRKCISTRSRKLAPLIWPSSKALKQIRLKIKEFTSSRWLRIPLETTIKWLNRVILGWRNYFGIGNGTVKFQKLDGYVTYRLWLYFRRKMASRGKCVLERYKEWIKQCGLIRFYQNGKFGRSW